MEPMINIHHIAKLARLRLDESQCRRFQKEMEAIVAMAEDLPEGDGAPALDDRHPLTLRQDDPAPCSIGRDELLRNAPQHRDGCFVVPKTVE